MSDDLKRTAFDDAQRALGAAWTDWEGWAWHDETKNLANAGVGTKKVTYNVKPGFYGRFVDPYNTSRGIENAEATNIGPKVVLKFPSVRPPVGYRNPPMAAEKR